MTTISVKCAKLTYNSSIEYSPRLRSVTSITTTITALTREESRVPPESEVCSTIEQPSGTSKHGNRGGSPATKTNPRQKLAAPSTNATRDAKIFRSLACFVARAFFSGHTIHLFQSFWHSPGNSLEVRPFCAQAGATFISLTQATGLWRCLYTATADFPSFSLQAYLHCHSGWEKHCRCGEHFRLGHTGISFFASLR